MISQRFSIQKIPGNNRCSDERGIRRNWSSILCQLCAVILSILAVTWVSLRLVHPIETPNRDMPFPKLLVPIFTRWTQHPRLQGSSLADLSSLSRRTCLAHYLQYWLAAEWLNQHFWSISGSCQEPLIPIPVTHTSTLPDRVQLPPLRRHHQRFSTESQLL